MELLQVVPNCMASADDVGEADHKEYVTVKIRKKCKNLHSLCNFQHGHVWKFMSSRWYLFVSVECHYIHDWAWDRAPKKHMLQPHSSACFATGFLVDWDDAS